VSEKRERKRERERDRHRQGERETETHSERTGQEMVGNGGNGSEEGMNGIKRQSTPSHQHHNPPYVSLVSLSTAAAVIRCGSSLHPIPTHPPHVDQTVPQFVIVPLLLPFLSIPGSVLFTSIVSTSPTLRLQ
jgi:hypothetical protein